jgi:hypothetical protein
VYQSQLESAGFVNVTVTQVSRQVFGGFSTFAASRASLLREFVLPHVWLKFVVTGQVLGWVHRNQVLDYIIVTADKQALTTPPKCST